MREDRRYAAFDNLVCLKISGVFNNLVCLRFWEVKVDEPDLAWVVFIIKSQDL